MCRRRKCGGTSAGGLSAGCGKAVLQQYKRTEQEPGEKGVHHSGRKAGALCDICLELVEAVQDKEQTVDVTHMGETNIVITYETQKHKHVVWSWAKTVLVCFLTFFGGAFPL